MREGPGNTHSAATHSKQVDSAGASIVTLYLPAGGTTRKKCALETEITHHLTTCGSPIGIQPTLVLKVDPLRLHGVTTPILLRATAILAVKKVAIGESVPVPMAITTSLLTTWRPPMSDGA